MQAYYFLLLITISVAVSLIAATIAYAVTYSQSRKIFTDKKHVRNAALQSSLYTYVLFMVISLVAALYLSFSGILGKTF
jgi:hypothetical protein